jgi:hypothetical protein
MIEIECPRCHKRLVVDESKAGTVGLCPGCATTIAIPDPYVAPEDDPDEGVLPERDLPRGRRRGGAYREERVTPRPRRRAEETDEEEQVHRPRKRKRRRPRYEPEREGMDPVVIGVLVVGGLGLILFGLAVAVPAIALAPIILGWLLVFAGGLWFLAIAFMEDPIQGLLCLCVPGYSLYFLIVNFDLVRRPFFLQVVGWVIMILSGVVFGFAAVALGGR